VNHLIKVYKVHVQQNYLDPLCVVSAGNKRQKIEVLLVVFGWDTFSQCFGQSEHVAVMSDVHDVMC